MTTLTLQDLDQHAKHTKIVGLLDVIKNNDLIYGELTIDDLIEDLDGGGEPHFLMALLVGKGTVDKKINKHLRQILRYTYRFIYSFNDQPLALLEFNIFLKCVKSDKIKIWSDLIDELYANKLKTAKQLSAILEKI
jgi:hypothetical protein